MGALICAHYVGLLEASWRSEDRSDRPGGWAFLSGLLCGGAAGMKYVGLAVIPASLICLIYYDWTRYQKKMFREFLSWRWLGGLLIAGSPWWLRTAFLTGNPVYPYLNGLFNGHLVKPWHQIIPISYADSNGMNSFVYVLSSLTGFCRDQGKFVPAAWGGTLIWVMVVPIFWKSAFPRSLRLWVVAGVSSWFILSASAVETRYQIGLWSFLVCLPFAFVVNFLLSSPQALAVKRVVFGAVCAAFIYTCLSSGMLGLIFSSVKMALYGFSPGNYRTGDQGLDQLRWITHLINRNTDKNEGVIYAGIPYIFGLERPLHASYYLDKELILEYAQRSSDADDLKNMLTQLKVRHLLLRSDFLKKIRSEPNRDMRAEEKDAVKLEEFIGRCAVLRAETPQRYYQWYGLKMDEPYPKITINLDDVLDYPVSAMEHAGLLFHAGDLDQAERISRMILSAPVVPYVKVYAYLLLGDMERARNNLSEALSCLERAGILARGNAELLYAVGLFYEMSLARYPQAQSIFIQAQRLDPRAFEIVYHLGYCSYKMADYLRSLQYFEEALRLKPGDQKTRNNIGSLRKIVFPAGYNG